MLRRGILIAADSLSTREMVRRIIDMTLDKCEAIARQYGDSWKAHDEAKSALCFGIADAIAVLKDPKT
jgi:hypothetical protein